MKIEPLVSIVTINYNGLSDTCELLDTIPVADTVETIVVDNGSREDEASVIEQRYPHVTVVRSDENLGFAGGNNLGIRASHGRYIFLVNNDTLLDGDNDDPTAQGSTDVSSCNFFQPLIDRLESSPTIGMVCPKLRFSWDSRPIQFAGYTPLSSITLRNSAIGCGEEDHGQYDVAHPTPYAHGAAMLVKREAIDRAGLMPECYFLYYEELDWSVMMTRAGYEIWYDHCRTVFHKESQTTGQGSTLRTYYISRNRLLFARRNIKMPRRLLTCCYLVCVVATRDICRHLIHGAWGHVKAVCRGVRDGIVGAGPVPARFDVYGQTHASSPFRG